MKSNKLWIQLRNKIIQNSFFIKASVIFFCIILITSCAFWGYTINTEKKNAQSDIEYMILDQLKLTSNSVELLLEDLSQTLEQTLWDKDFVNALINSSNNDYERTVRILTKLNGLTHGYATVEQAFLYSNTQNIFYTSNFSVDKVDSDTNLFLQEAKSEQSRVEIKITDDDCAPFLVKYNGKLYFCKNLYPNYIESIGMLIFQLNLNSIGHLDSFNYIFSKDGEPILCELFN